MTSDRIAVEVVGMEPRAVVVSAQLTSTASVSTNVDVFVDGLRVTPGPEAAAVFQAACGDSIQRSVDLAWAPFREPVVTPGHITSPGAFECVFEIVPTQPLLEPIEVEWYVSALVQWGYEDRHTEVDVTFDVSLE